jgi:hypothetical protein
MRWGFAALSLAVISAAVTSGCKVQINKDDNGEEKDVKIATPLGGINVKTNQTTALDLGLPEYPGSQVSSGGKGDESANVNMGFGGWQLRVKVATYKTPDSQDKVIAFYRKALKSYGDVIECARDKAVGSPAITREGLSCGGARADEENLHLDDSQLQLKAGSHHHQHLVVIESHPGAATTEFSLISLDLPHGSGGRQQTN